VHWLPVEKTVRRAEQTVSFFDQGFVSIIHRCSSYTPHADIAKPRGNFARTLFS
jgi:hypothetical protein